MRHLSYCLALALVASSAAIAVPALAAIPGADPDWPCQQRLVPELTGATLWNGPPLPADAKWQSDKRIAGLVTSVAARDLPVEEGEAQLGKFVDAIKPAERKTLVPEIFVGIVDEVNRQRGDVISRIKDLDRRQKSVGDVVAKVSAELEQIPEDAQGDEAKRRDEIVQRRDYVIRMFEETERTMRYACEAPVNLEARLGDYARLLQAKLGS